MQGISIFSVCYSLQSTLGVLFTAEQLLCCIQCTVISVWYLVQSSWCVVYSKQYYGFGDHCTVYNVHYLGQINVVWCSVHIIHCLLFSPKNSVFVVVQCTGFGMYYLIQSIKFAVFSAKQ